MQTLHSAFQALPARTRAAPGLCLLVLPEANTVLLLTLRVPDHTASPRTSASAGWPLVLGVPASPENLLVL